MLGPHFCHNFYHTLLMLQVVNSEIVDLHEPNSFTQPLTTSYMSKL